LPSKVLVVDDHASWRRQIAAFLQKTGEWVVMGEAADGPEAVALAAKTVPDVILLDLELPTLSGIDAAARILAANPSARILYLTGHRSWEVVEAALVGGARGYVLKPYAAVELLPAMAAVVAGRRFVSTVLGGRALLDNGHPTTHVHEAALHRGDRTLLAEYEAFAAAALNGGKAVIGVGDAARRHALVDGLRLRGVDIDRALEEGRFRMLDSVEMLRAMMVDGVLNESRFWERAMRQAIGAARASREDPPAMVVFGDGAQCLYHDGNIKAAIRLEQLWGDFARTFNAEIFCGYGEPLDERAADVIRSTHTAVHMR